MQDTSTPEPLSTFKAMTGDSSIIAETSHDQSELPPSGQDIDGLNHREGMMPAPGLIPPHVNAVGVVHYPADFRGVPRTYSAGTRAFVWSLIIIFGSIVVFTTVASLGAYCLTSDGGDTRALHSSPLFEDSQSDD